MDFRELKAFSVKLNDTSTRKQKWYFNCDGESILLTADSFHVRWGWGHEFCHLLSDVVDVGGAKQGGWGGREREIVLPNHCWQYSINCSLLHIACHSVTAHTLFTMWLLNQSVSSILNIDERADDKPAMFSFIECFYCVKTLAEELVGKIGGLHVSDHLRCVSGYTRKWSLCLAIWVRSEGNNIFVTSEFFFLESSPVTSLLRRGWKTSIWQCEIRFLYTASYVTRWQTIPPWVVCLQCEK